MSWKKLTKEISDDIYYKTITMNKFEKHIDNLISRILSEEIEHKSKKMSEKIKGDWTEIEVDEELHGNQSKLDVAAPKGKLTSADFKKLRNKKEVDEMYFEMPDIEDYDDDDDDSFDSYDTDEPKWDVPRRHRRMRPSDEKDMDLDLKMRDMEEQETEEGNAFTGALAKAKKEGKGSFEVDGKEYNVTESKEKWIQKTGMSKGALHKKLGVPEGETIPVSKLKSLKSELTKKGEGDKKLSASDLKLLKQVNLALTLKKVNESKKTLKLSESELIDFIEKLVKEQSEKVKPNISVKSPKGLTKTQEVIKKSKGESDENAKEVSSKMSNYLKDGSKGKFEMNPDIFPKGNGEIEKMNKKAYTPSGAVEEYIENFAYPGLENLSYDEIKPNDKWVEDNLVGSSRTGNNPKWANAVDTGLGEKFNEKRKKNLYQKEKQRSYKRVTQPVDEAGEGEGEKELDNMFAKLESKKDKKTKLISEDMSKMKNLISYNRKTQ